MTGRFLQIFFLIEEMDLIGLQILNAEKDTFYLIILSIQTYATNCDRTLKAADGTVCLPGSLK